MKNYFFIVVAALVMSACKQKELDNSNRQKDSLVMVVNERDSTMNEFITSFNDVERNLDSVAVRQHIISTSTDKTGEFKPNQKEHINAEIEAINKLMDKNRKQISELNRKIKNSSKKNAYLEKMIVTLNDQIAQKDLELTDLNAKLTALNVQVVQLQTSVDTLTVQNNVQAQTIADETIALHTAYYVAGKAKELLNAKIIDKKGGMLGLGKTAKLNGDFDNSKFKRIDFTQTTSIPVNSEMKFVTSHPSDSYTLDTDAKNKDIVKNILITNPEKFWGGSKYLVIVKD